MVLIEAPKSLVTVLSVKHFHAPALQDSADEFAHILVIVTTRMTRPMAAGSE